jgi:hypothetical protein
MTNENETSNAHPGWVIEQLRNAMGPEGWSVEVVGPDTSDDFGDYLVRIAGPGEKLSDQLPVYIASRSCQTIRFRVREKAEHDLGLPDPYADRPHADEELPVGDAPECIHCGGPITGYGPEDENWEPSVCNECCVCHSHVGQPLAGEYDPDAFRCWHCGSWDVDRHGDTPPGFDPGMMPCPSCNEVTPHRQAPSLLVRSFGREIADAPIWRCRQCEFANWVTNPENNWRQPIDSEDVPLLVGNEIGLPLLEPKTSPAPTLVADPPCDGEHGFPWCCDDDCYLGLRPREGDLVLFEEKEGAEYPRRGIGIVQTVGPKTVEVGIRCDSNYFVGRLFRRVYPDVEVARVIVQVRREKL